MIEKIERYYLEISSEDNFEKKSKPSENYIIQLIEPSDFELNKFFYKLSLLSF